LISVQRDRPSLTKISAADDTRDKTRAVRLRYYITFATLMSSGVLRKGLHASCMKLVNFKDKGII